MRTLAVRRRVDCPFSAAVEFAREVLGAESKIAVSPFPGPAESVRLHTDVVDDVSDPVRRHDALHLTWTPAHALFPHLNAVLTARPHGRDCTLQLRAYYEPPLQMPGRIFDALFGRAAARLTLRRFLARLTGSIERRWSAARTSLGAPPQSQR